MPAPSPTPSPPRRSPPDSELLIKGAVCALIGLIILLAPFVARSPDVREMMRQAHVAGWFALVLGCAFLARHALHSWRDRRGRR